MPGLIIGKIPGYNANTNRGKINYTDRLLNNLTIVRFSPIGYKLNLNFSFSDLFKTEDEKSARTNRTSKSSSGTKSIYKLGQDISSTVAGKAGLTNTYSALSVWHEMQRHSFKEALTPCDYFDIIATSDSTINETITNEFSNNQLENIGGFLGSSVGQGITAAKQFSGLVKQAVSSVSTAEMVAILESKDKVSDSHQLFQLLSSQVLGVQVALPKIWTRSDYNNTSSFTIKLISPSGHPEDIKNFILKPLKILTLAVSPITYDGISYGYAPLWKTEAEGLYANNLTAITAMTISRGGQDTTFNRYNQPTIIDVRITVEPLVNGFATPLKSGISYYTNQATSTEVNMLVSSPQSVLRNIDKDNRDALMSSKLLLNPLVL